MANTNILSYSITDGLGDVKSLPIYFPTGLTVPQIQGDSDQLAPLIDSCIDGKLTAATLTLNLTLPSGMKGAAGGDNRVGALLSFDCASTPYRFSAYVPSWLNDGFTDNAVADGSPNDDLIAAFLAGVTYSGGTLAPSDRYANDIVAFLQGVKKTRK